MIIDFHTHFFPDRLAPSAIAQISGLAGVKYHSDGTAKGLADNMKRFGIDLSVSLPVATRADQVFKLNSHLIEAKDELMEMGILSFGAIHPDYEDVKGEIKRLKEHGFKGLKIHPAYQGRDLDDIRFLRLLAAAAEEDMIVLTHGGLDIGFPTRNFNTAGMVLKVLREVGEMKLVLAHMGSWSEWDETEKYLCGAPVWIDTGFSLGPVEMKDGFKCPAGDDCNLDEERFVSLSRKHGTDRVLFATDSPWAPGDKYIAFIERSALTPEEKEAVFSGNAKRLLGI